MQGGPCLRGGETGLLSPVLAAGICSRDGAQLAEPSCPWPCPVLWGCVFEGLAWKRECCGVAGGAQRAMAVPRRQESRGH